MLEKRKILEACIKLQKEVLKNLKQSLKKAQQEVKEAVGSKTSWSDTNKFQQSNLALGIQRRIGEAELILDLIENTEPSESKFIMVGTFFSLKDIASEETFHYFLVCEGGGGGSVKIEDKEIKFISEGAPIAFSVKGREKGEKINFRNRIFEVIEVQ